MSLCCPICEAGADKCLCGDEQDLLDHLNKYLDNYGFLHLRQRPSPQDSENGPMYTALFYVVYREIAPLPYIENPYKHLLNDVDEYTTTPGSPSSRWSHDNMTGLVCASDIFNWPWNLYFWKQHLHPRDFIFYRWAKHQSFFWWLLLPVPVIAMIISCAQTYKTRNGKKIVKTDGKLLTLMRCLAFDMKLTLKICTWLISINDKFQTWEKVALRYFQSSEHPCVKVIREWENANRM